MKEVFKTPSLVRLALVAALYVVMTLMLPALSFGPVQMRVSEILVLLCFYRRDYSVALVLGCFIANCFSPMALLDMIFGTLATAIAVIPMYSVKNIWAASLLPVASNAVIVGIELNIAFGEPIWMSVLTVGIGELAAVTVLGCVLFRFVLEKNGRFMSAIGSKKTGIDI